VRNPSISYTTASFEARRRLFLAAMIHHLHCHITTYVLPVTNIITMLQSPPWCSSGCFPIHSASTPPHHQHHKKFCRKHFLILSPYHFGFTTQMTLGAYTFIVQFRSLLANDAGTFLKKTYY